MSFLSGALARPWVRWYLTLVALFYAYGAFAHFANMFNYYGPDPWPQAPLSLKVADAVFGSLDVIAALGMIFRLRIGVAAYLLVSLSQILLYTTAGDVFSNRPGDQTALQVMVVFHLVSLGLFIALMMIPLRADDRGSRYRAAA